MLNHALKYLKLGFSIIPLESRGKKPLIPWQEFQKRRATENEVRKWFATTPNANLGIVTGSISGVVVIDLDGPEGIQEAISLGIESRIISLTGDGKHLWFRVPLTPSTSSVQNAVRIFPGIDIRGEGGYVVAPPSIHESGRRYRWLKPFAKGLLDVVPALLIASPVEKDFVTAKEESWTKRPEGWVAQALQEMKHGNIDDTLFKVCSRLRADGYSELDARTLLSPWSTGVDATPGHLDEKIKNVWDRYTPRLRGDNGTGLQKSLRLYASAEQPRVLSSSEGLVIHSPTNPDSLAGFEQARSAVDNGGEAGLKTGYSKLDTMLQGGLKSSRLFTIAARTGVGKTNFLLGMSRELCRQGKKVLLFSTEMPYAQIWERYIETLQDRDEFKQHSFYICDSFAPNLERVEEAINEIRPEVFMFDHINHVSEEQRELGAFMQGLNFIRRKYECAGIVTAQLNRSADWVDLKTGEKVTPRMSMIKGSGTIEQASSRVLLLSETRVSPEGTEIVGNLDKNDNGDKGLLHFMLKSKPYRMVEL